VEPQLPRHAHAAVNLHAVARCGIIGLGRRDARRARSLAIEQGNLLFWEDILVDRLTGEAA
jgi:hypothetical protein